MLAIRVYLRAMAVTGAIAVSIAIASGKPVDAATGVECVALLGRADVYAAGKLSSAYVKALVSSGRAVLADGGVDRATIMNGCSAGAFDALIAAQGIRTSATDRYTEAQARERFESAGLGSVDGLREDKQGIWWATAMQSGKCVTGSLDTSGKISLK